MGIRKTTEQFIEEARAVHGDKYDYSKTVYTKAEEKVTITCPKHGDFEQQAHSHLTGNGCKECRKENLHNRFIKSQESILKEFRDVHGDKYDYSKVKYDGAHVKVEIVCPKHGSFWQTPNVHIRGRGCKRCANEALSKLRTKDIKVFIEDAIKVHGNYYDYSKFVYVDNKTPSTIICPKHGEFEQQPSVHLSGSKCPKCALDNMADKFRQTTDHFINRAKEVHGSKYDYSKVNYINWYENVEIICPEHGSFWQAAGNHLQGKGCPQCKWFKTQKYVFERCKSEFSDIEWLYETSTDWLKPQRFDIYNAKYNIAIEYNGEQHYNIIEAFGGEEKFKYTQEKDAIKREKCLQNNCHLFIIKYDNLEEDITNTFIKIKNIIKNE